MKKHLVFVFFLLSIAFQAKSVQKFGNIGNLMLENGDTLFDCKIGYMEFGKINSDSSNIIIFPSWYGGTAEQIKGSLGKGNLIDSTKYFVITLDALSNGISTSPSNSIKQPHKKFPQISMRDMVNSQYILLTKILKIKKIFAVIGGSMGSMQTLEWIVAYPEFMEKAVPYVCTPRVTSSDLLTWNLRKEIIESYMRLNADEKQIQKVTSMMMSLLVRTFDHINQNVKVDEFDKYMAKFDAEPNKIFTSENSLYQLNAMINHNIFRNDNNSMEKTAAKIKAKVMMIVSETDMLVNPKSSLEFAPLINARVLKLNNNCGHLAPGCELAKSSAEIEKFLSE